MKKKKKKIYFFSNSNRRSRRKTMTKIIFGTLFLKKTDMGFNNGEKKSFKNFEN
jgi:hypothetical protein